VHLEQAPLKDERLANELRKELETILRLALRQRKGPQKGRIPGKTFEELKSLGYLKRQIFGRLPGCREGGKNSILRRKRWRR